MRKRGQAAVFIIIGLIVLIVAISLIIIKRDVLTDLFERISTERTTIPQQVRPLQDSLDSCVTQITKDAVITIGLQGGYINLKEDSIPNTEFTPLGNNLEIIPGSDFKTAVWFRERGNGIQELNVPTKTDIENEIENYLLENFGSCVFNLTNYEEKGYLISASGIPKPSVEFGDGKISAIVNFPINVKISDTNFTLSQHRADIDSGLGKLYNMAKQILTKENENYFLESKTIDTLVAYDPEVPFSGTDLSCRENVWLKSDVERKLKNILFENVAAMHIKGTNYKLNDEKLKYLEFDALENKDSSVTVNLMYIPNWPTVVEITPSEGNILRSDLISKNAGGPISTIMSSFFCLNQHRFVYDIKYPVLISLIDNNGFIFQFATEVIIDNNRPRENRKEILDLPDSESPICRYPQQDVKIVTGFVNQEGTFIQLENVSLNFKCFPASCSLESSKLNKDGSAVTDAKVPLCFNGIIEGFKEGYKQVQKTIYSSNDKNTPDVAIVELEPLHNKKVNVFVVEKNTGKIREPYSTEQINFQFAHKEANYQTTYIYPSEDNQIQLLAGTYSMNSYILRNSSTYKISIPKEKIETCIDSRDFGLFGFFNKKQVCQTTETDEMEFDTILTGGATNFEHEFKREELSNDKPLNLYVLSSNIPSNLDELQRIQIEIDSNKDNPLFREPEIA